MGVSNYDEQQLAEFDAIRPVEVLQPPYHLFRRGIEDAVLPYAREHDIGVLAYSPLASGLVSGRWDEHIAFDADDWRSQPGVDVAIVGSGRPESSAAAAEVGLSPDDLAEIERIVTDAVPVEGARPEGID